MNLLYELSIIFNFNFHFLFGYIYLALIAHIKMNTQGSNMKYPKHFQEYRAPEINLPYGGKITRVILTYFTIEDENDKSDPTKGGSCKTCG